MEEKISGFGGRGKGRERGWKNFLIYVLVSPSFLSAQVAS